MKDDHNNTLIEADLDWDEYFMRKAYLATSKSKDPSSKVGAVLVTDGNDFCSGFNGFPRGIADTRERLYNRETKYKYIIHAEQNAIINAARLGRPTLGAVMYTIGMPCTECAKAIIQAGIKEIVLHDNAIVNFKHGKWAESCAFSNGMLEEAGVNVRLLCKKLGIQTLVNGKLEEV